MELLIKHGLVVSPEDGLNSEADIYIRDGRIADIIRRISFRARARRRQEDIPLSAACLIPSLPRITPL